jgi:hypothetical protein
MDMKRIGIFGVLAVFLLAFGVNASTTIDTTWDGSGTFRTDFSADDDATNFLDTEGKHIQGEYHAINHEDNPYGYGVNSVEVRTKANIERGYIEYQYDRTDSKESMYGSAGQRSYTWIGADAGQFAWRSTSNFAQMRNCNHGWQSNGQFKAQGEHDIYHSFLINENEGAEFHVSAVGNTEISDMSEDHSGSSYKFGKGCGCYTNAKVNILGSGVFDLGAYADNEIKTDTGITTDGYLNIHATFNNKFQYDNFALSGN